MRVVLITGCSSGIGYMTALKFAQNGFYTFASVRNLDCDGAKSLLQAKITHNLPLEVLQIDVTLDESVKKGVYKVIEMVGHIDVLINNAGFGYLGPIEDFEIAEIKNQYETNIFGVLRMVRAVVPTMRAQGCGHIINISSINGIVSFPLFSIYSSSKFAVETLSEGLRFELGHFGIKVAIVEPGSFLTDFTKNRKHPKKFGQHDSPYKPLTDNFFARYQKTHDRTKASVVSKVLTAEPVVETIFKIANSKNPKARYMVGLDAYIYYTLRRILPNFLWEWLLHKVYKW